MTTGLRVALFGSGSPLSTIVLESLASRALVAAVVVPGLPRIRSLRSAARAAARWRARRPLAALAHRVGAPLVSCSPRRRERLEARMRGLTPDLVCVASFPYLLPPSLLAVPRIGALGLHPSLLPLHRGPEPLFWTYFEDDRETGVTLHWLDAGEDTGDVVAQQAIPLARGRPVEDLYEEIARRGSVLLLRAIDDLAAGRLPRTPQDHSRATRDPLPRPGTWRIDFSAWDTERVWHVLAGIGGRHGRLLSDASGRPLRHGAACGLVVQSHGRQPGTIERAGDGWRVFCRDGIVEVQGPR